MSDKNRELLETLDEVLAPLDSKIDHSLYIGTVEQMRVDLVYIRELLADARAEIKETLAS